MGLIYSILIGFIHLFFVAMDIFFMMMIVKTVYDRWKPSWLKEAAHAIEPIMTTMIDYVGGALSKITGKRYSDKTLLVLIIVCLTLARFTVTSLL